MRYYQTFVAFHEQVAPREGCLVECRSPTLLDGNGHDQGARAHLPRNSALAKISCSTWATIWGNSVFPPRTRYDTPDHLLHDRIRRRGCHKHCQQSHSRFGWGRSYLDAPRFTIMDTSESVRGEPSASKACNGSSTVDPWPSSLTTIKGMSTSGPSGCRPDTCSVT